MADSSAGLISAVVVLAILTAVSLVAQFDAVRTPLLGLFSGTGAATGGIGASLMALIGSLYVSTPIAIFAFGFIYDIVTQSFGASIPSLVGLTAGIVNKLIQVLGVRFGGFTDAAAAAYRAAAVAASSAAGTATDAVAAAAPAAAGPVRPPNPFAGGFKMYGGVWEEACNISGMSLLDGGFTPASLVLMTTILGHYMIMGWAKNPYKSIAPSVTLAVLWIVHGYVIFNNCPQYDLLKIGMGILLGFGFAGVSYSLTLLTPSSSLNSPAMGSPIVSSSGPLGSTSGTCAPPNDNDQFVCDAYKNGQKITSTLVE